MKKTENFKEKTDKITISPSLLTKMSMIKIPLNIFHNKDLTPMQAIVFHLKSYNLTYREISYLINRNERNIWTIYNQAKKKLDKKKEWKKQNKTNKTSKRINTKVHAKVRTTDKTIKLPLHIFHNKNLTPAEAIISHLKDYHNQTYHQISILINRDERNVWKIYNNAKKKLRGKIKK